MAEVLPGCSPGVSSMLGFRSGQFAGLVKQSVAPVTKAAGGTLSKWHGLLGKWNWLLHKAHQQQEAGSDLDKGDRTDTSRQHDSLNPLSHTGLLCLSTQHLHSGNLGLWMKCKERFHLKGEGWTTFQSFVSLLQVASDVDWFRHWLTEGMQQLEQMSEKHLLKCFST